MSRQYAVITVMALLLMTIVSTAYLLNRESLSTDVILTGPPRTDPTTPQTRAEEATFKPLIELEESAAHDDRSVALELESPSHVDSASAQSAATSVAADYDELYAEYGLADLKGALMKVARRREELAEPLIKAKFATGDFRLDSPVMRDETYGIDISPMHQDLQPVLCVRLEPIPGTHLKQPTVVQIDADEDPDLLLASMEHRWLLNRIRILEEHEEETGNR